MTAVDLSDAVTRGLLVQVMAAMVRHDLESRNSTADQESLDSDTQPVASDTQTQEVANGQ